MVNPYATPEEFGDPATGNPEFTSPIQFSGRIEESQIRSLFNGVGMLLAVAAVIWLFFYSVWELLYLGWQLQVPRLILASSMVVLGLGRWLFDAVYNRLGPGYSKHLRDMFPEAFEFKTGWLDQQWLYLKTADREVRFHRTGIANVFTNGKILWLLMDLTGKDSQFFNPSHFPAGDFTNFQTAVTRDVVQNGRAKISIWQHSDMADPALVLPREWNDSGVLGQGVLTRQDLLTTPVRQKVRSMITKHLAWATFWILVVVSAAYLLSVRYPWAALLLLALWGAIVLMRLYRRLKLMGVGAPRKKPVLAVQVCLSGAGVQSATRYAVSDCHWNLFDHYFQADDVLAIHQKGTSESYVVLPRRFFSRQEDWEQACEIVSQKLPLAEPSTR